MIETERRAHELDIVELTEDLPEFRLRRGERGTVVEAFDHPEEAYVLEFVDESGSASKLAYGVRPDQIENIDSIAKEYYRKGMTALNSGEFTKSLRDLRKAIELIPSYIRGLHNSLAQSIGPHEDWPRFIFAMKLVRLLDPDYEMATENLAIAYLNLGVQEAKSGNYEQSLISFHAALAVKASQKILSLIKDNIAASYTALGRQAFSNKEIEKALGLFGSAHFAASNEMTRLNLGKAYFHYANFCSDAGDLARAIDAYQRAEDAGLVWPEVLNNHACALATSGEFQSAVMVFEAAASLAPQDNTISSNLSKLLTLSTVETKDLVTQDIAVNFLTPPMNTVALHVAA
jgi:tetratricopeptide (TPR) repeat protein